MPTAHSSRFDVAVVGDWHLAFVTAACFAKAGVATALVKPSGEWREALPRCPVSEVGVDEALTAAVEHGNLTFESSTNQDWDAHVVWLAIDTPINERDEPQLDSLIAMAEDVARRRSPDVFAVSSQVPLGFGHQLESILGPRIACVPENLRLGQGIETFFRADRTVIGGSTPEVAEQVQELMSGFETEFVVCSLETAEMVKHATNAFLATSISFANEMAQVGASHNVDSYVVAQALKLDARIGPRAYVSPGLGFAGGTLPRDLRVIEQLGRESKTPTRLTSAVLEVNRGTSSVVVDTVRSEIAAGLEARLRSGVAPRVLLLGYTYKADTDTLRRSMTIEIAKELGDVGVECHGFDPFMNELDLTELDGVLHHHNQLSDVPPCDVVLLMTARRTFLELDWTQLAAGYERSTIVIDTQRFLSSDSVVGAGLRYRPLWAPR